MTSLPKRNEAGWTLPLHSLPREFLRLLDDPPDPPVSPRPSATLALIREGGEGLEVLLLKRSPRSGFIPGAWVFPGGTVDEADGDRTLLPRVHGLIPEAAVKALHSPTSSPTAFPEPPVTQEAPLGLEAQAAPAPPAIAYWIAAARETFEETGILLYQGEWPGQEAVEGARTRLLDGDMSFEDVLGSLNGRLDAGAMTYVGHWLTPRCEPRRYETRFFVAEVPREVRVSPHEREMVDAVWISPAEALARNRKGSFRLVLPTLFTLDQLRAFSTPAAAIKHLEKQPVPRRLPIPERTDGGVLFRLSD